MKPSAPTVAVASDTGSGIGDNSIQVSVPGS
jgi:hypothetical protein